MDKKVENKNEKPILSKTHKILILIIAIVFSVFSVFNIYSEIRRQIMCSQIAVFNAQVPPSDIDSYILRKEAFENVCLERTGIGSYFWAIVSFWFLGYAITLFGKHPEPIGENTKQKIIHE